MARSTDNQAQPKKHLLDERGNQILSRRKVLVLEILGGRKIVHLELSNHQIWSEKICPRRERICLVLLVCEGIREFETNLSRPADVHQVRPAPALLAESGVLDLSHSSLSVFKRQVPSIFLMQSFEDLPFSLSYDASNLQWGMKQA